MIRIDSATDPRLAPYLAVRERDLVGRERLFVAEGEVVVRVLLERSTFRVRSLLLEERRVAPMQDVLDGVTAPILVVPQRVMDAVVGFSIHRGVLALGERGPVQDPALLLARGKIFVGLVGLTNHDNVGSIFRNAAAFGVDGVLLDSETCDPLYRKAIRVSAGTALVVPFARCSDLVGLLEREGVEAVSLTPRGEETIDSLPPARRALLLGTEGPGLPADLLARTRRVSIAMAPGLDSLNVAVASGIALHEVMKAARGNATSFP